MSNQLQKNHKKICRICLKDVNLQPLNEKYENTSITEMLQTCFKIQVQENDGLPQHICVICVSELAQAYKLSKKFQTSKIALDVQKPTPVALIKKIDPDINDDEFVLPDKSIDRKDIEIGGTTEFILFDKNIIKKIKDHNGQQEIPSPSEELKLAKFRIINANRKPINKSPESILKRRLLSKMTPGKVTVRPVEKNDKETPGKINILSIKTYKKDLTSIKGDIKQLQLDSFIKTKNKTETKTNETNEKTNKVETNEKTNEETNEVETNKKQKQISTNNISETKLKENSSRINTTKWNTRNKIYKNRRNKKLKKSRKDLLYSSAKYHEQFEKFLTVAKTTNNQEKMEEIPENTDPEEPQMLSPQQSTNSKPNNNIKTIKIKNKLVTGYVRRFENKKECPICKKIFKYLEPHLRIHSNKELVLLKQINETKEKLSTNREKTHENPKKYTCSLCDKSFKVRSSLQRHYNMHTKDNLYECDICKKRSYNIKSNLYRHQRVCSIKNAKHNHREL